MTYSRSDYVAVFLINPNGDALELTQSTNSADVPLIEDTYARGEGVAGCAWESNQVVLDWSSGSRPGGDAPSHAASSAPSVQMGVPVRNLMEEVVGIVLCIRRPEATCGRSGCFSATDEIVMTALAAAAAPHIERMIGTERRTRAITRLSHELKMPLSGILGAVEFMRREAQSHGWTFSEDYLGDIYGYVDLMGGLVSTLDHGGRDIDLTLNRTRVFLFRDIVAPATKQLQIPLSNRGLSSQAVTLRGIDRFPAMFLDKERFQQVVFNLLSNAVKYADRDPSAFHIEIIGLAGEDGCDIIFQDWGVGFEPGMENAAFLEGVRGPNAHRYDVTGAGIGLWVVRRIVEAHGGKIAISNTHHPTELTVHLPRSASCSPTSR